MKRLLSIFLVLCMVTGLGVCGTVSASADEFDDLRNEVLGMFEGFKADVGLFPYTLAWTSPSLRPEFEEGLLPDKDKDAVFAALDSLTDAAMVAYDEAEELDGDMPQAVLDEFLASFDAILSENFSSDFLDTFTAFKTAYVQAFSPVRTYIEEFNLITYARLWNPVSFFRVMNFLLWVSEGMVSVMETGTFAEFTDFFVEGETRLNLLLNPQIWWQNLPDFLQWILHYVFFGWIWMDLA